MRFSSFITLLIIISLPLHGETVVFSSHFQQHEDEFTYVEQYFHEVAYNIEGLDIVMKYLPLERSIYYLEKGEIDGDSGRAGFVYEDSKNVIRIESPILTMDYLYLSSVPFTDNLKEDLAGGRVLINRGALVTIRYLESQGIPYSVVTTPELALKMLKNGRAQYYLCPEFTTNFLEENINKYFDIYISETVFTLDAYLFIHKRHKNWIPELERVIQMLNISGKNFELLGFKNMEN